MESLSRPLHRRKLSNVNSFSGKNAYDGVFSGHRRTHGGAPAVSGDDYREIFAADCSIPVLDLSAVGEASDGLDVDYGKIFGGFRELEIAVSYEEMVARDKDRAPSSTSQSPQDVGDLSRQSSDALKQYNMSYNKISQRNKDGLDGTTHVTQLHAVPGFTCFIDESASQLDKETVKQKSSSTNNVNVKSSKQDTPEKQTTENNYYVNTSKRDFPEKQAMRDFPEKQTTENNYYVNTSKRDFPEKQATRDFPEKQTTENNNNVNTSKRDFPEKQTTENNNNVNTRKRDFPEKQTTENNINVKSSKQDIPEKQTIENNNNVNTSKGELPEKQAMDENNNVSTRTRDFPEKQTSQTNVEFRSKYQEESLSSDKSSKTFEVNFKSHPSKVLSPESKKEAKDEKSPAAKIVPSSPPAAPQPKNETEKQKSSVTNIVRPSEKVDIHEKQTSKTAVESQSRYAQDEFVSDDITFKPFHTDFKSYPPKVSSSPAASATNLDNHKDYQKRSTAKSGEFPRACFDEELDVNSAAAASTAALRKAIEKAQESIRIAKESVGRKKEGRRGFSSKRFKDSLKVKARVANVDAGEEQKAKDDKIKEMDHKNGSTVVFPDFADFAVDEKLFGTTKVVNEIHGKTPESVKNYEMPIKSSVELNNNTMVCSSKHDVGKTETKSIENNTYEDPQKNNERPDSFLVLESCENKLGDIESNNLTVCQKVEIEKEISQTSDQNGFEKKSGEESFRLLENNMQENLEQKHDSKVVGAERQDEDERQVKEDGGTESHSEEENFYDVCEVEMIKNAQTYANSIDTNDLSQKENYEYHKAEETFENSSSDYDDAENENTTGTSNAVDDSEEACEVDQVEFNAEISRDIDDVSCSRSFQVDYKEPVEKVIFEDIASDETKDNKEEREAKSDNLENCGLTDVDFGQDDTQFESFVDTIHGMEIEVKECKEREEIVEKEENNLQPSLEETPEIRIEMDTGTPQEPKDACKEPEPSKVADDKEEKERERIKLAVERAIREARERAFLEVRQRVIADTQEKVTKASIDKISAQSKLRAERALVERATAEARRRALEKAMRTSEPRTQVNESKQTSSTSQTNTESALRSKAKLEKHNRIMERAARALAEKEKRDLLALKEQAERNRLSETLDADIKRWSTGKEGNLRALLSTLQYILGADSGWQPVSLTEIITTSAVKKAYRKATLCVHPDKLQQRGASIQQKYICEKVFDLLKAAWNRFNSEER